MLIQQRREKEVAEVWARWPDEFMCAENEIADNLKTREADYHLVSVRSFSPDGSPAAWRVLQ